MLIINDELHLDDDELQWHAIRAQGAGGQNVNKVSSAVHLRFDVLASSLPQTLKQRLLDSTDRRINNDGIVVIKAQRFRTQEKNRADAIERLRELITNAAHVAKKRKPTRPTRASQRRRLDSKNRRGQTKRLRGKVDE